MIPKKESTKGDDRWGRDTNQECIKDPKTGIVETKEDRDRRLEAEHFLDIKKSFCGYEDWQRRRFQVKEQDWFSLPDEFIKMIPNMPQKFKYISFCLKENQKFLDSIVDDDKIRAMMNLDEFEKFENNKPPKLLNLDKVRSTLHQCVRDWSTLGEPERKMCYDPILRVLCEFYPNESERGNIKVLNPGCGLGRLTWEIAKLGFQSQGNEFSYHMLLCSNLILNHAQQENEFQIYPWIDSVTNAWRFRDQCRKISLPDKNPRSLPQNAKFSMVAGEFLEVYSEENSWDVVVTCFFIDTARNVFDYLKTLSLIIKPGGWWINLGPLLYHFEDMKEASVELTYEELRAIIPQFGFEFFKENLGVSSTYARNELSMLQTAYNSAFMCCQRVSDKSRN